MWRRGALGAMTAVALAGGTLGLAPVAMAATTTTNVHGGDITGWNTSATPVAPMPNGWFAQSDNQAGKTAVGEVVGDDSAAPTTDGYLHLATPAADDKVVLQHGAATATLASFVTGSYAAQVIGTKVEAPATYQLVIDCNGGTFADGGYATLNSVDAGQTAAAGWKTLDVVNGGNAMWWSTKTLNENGTTSSQGTAPTTAGGLQGGQGTPHKLSDIKSTCAAGTVSTYGVDMGSGTAGQAGNVDTITFNDAVSNFQYVYVDRLSGSNRVATAVRASQALFAPKAQTGHASEVVLASSEGFADGVSGGPLAAFVDGPLLLTGGAKLDPTTATEIKRTLPLGGTVNVLGGTGAISAAVATSLTDLGFKVTRLSGANRYETAVEVAKSMTGVKTILLTSGTVFPDALSAGPAAAHSNGVVLLTQGAIMPSATKAYLDSHTGTEVYAVGGAAAQAAPTTPTDHKLVGTDRYQTGTKVAGKFFTNPDTIVFASGENFPDALSGGAFSSLVDAPILLVRSAVVPPVVMTYMAANDTTVSAAALVGGAGVVNDDVMYSIEDCLNGY